MASVEGLVVALLAAGRSGRFGAADKLTALLAGRPLIDWAADAGRSVNAAQHFVVTGPDMPQIFCPDGYVPLVNLAAEEGLGSSLRMAARHARETGASALLVLLADMPFVRPSHLSLLIATFDIDPAIPVFSRAPGNAAQPPAILPSALFPTLEALGGDSGARSLARGATLVEAPADTLIDVDTPADLALCAQLLGR
ncbi:MAG: nucleotidyltransferase family protein [Sphingobium sp.]|nr:nucleotidyltransferase family protein [Sphingobium sp.]